MSSSAQCSALWGQYELNPTIKVIVEPVTQKNDERIEIEHSPAADTNSKLQSRKRNRWNDNEGDGHSYSIHIPMKTGPRSDLPYLIKVPSLLPKYCNFMYTIGILPNNRKFGESGVSRMRMALYWVFSTLSMADALKLAKYLSIGYVEKGNLYRYYIMLHKMLRVLIRMYFTYVMFCNRDKIAQLQETIDELMTDTTTRNVKKEYSNHIQEKLTLASILTLTLFGSFVATMFGFASITLGWSIVSVITDKASQMASIVFVWTSNVTAADEIEDYLIDQYGENISCMSAFFGVSWMVLELFGRIYDNVVIDMLLLTILTMSKLTKAFEFKTTSPIEVKTHAEMVWKHYKQLQKISVGIDLTFGSIFKWIHVSNLSTCGSYLLILTESGARYNVYFILSTITILKILLIYLVAANVSNSPIHN